MPARAEKWTPHFAGSPGLWFLILVLAGALVRVAFALHLPLPTCWFRRFTGWPCPGCGCTRSLLATAQGDFGQAFRLNPLFAATTWIILALAIGWGIEKLVRHQIWPRPEFLRSPRFLAWSIGLLVLLNWYYLWQHHGV